MTWRETLAHAFAVKDPAHAWSEEDLALLDRVAHEVAKRRMQAPALLFLETVRPLNFVGSQVLVFLQPIAGAVFQGIQWERLGAILEQRESIDLLIRRIEEQPRG
jgi:hypothetical protein